VALKVKIPQQQKKKIGKGMRLSQLSWSNPLIKLGLVAFVVTTLVSLAVFSYYYVKYDRIVEARIRGPIFSASAKIYARSPVVEVGDKYTLDDIVSELRRAGYSESGSKVGNYPS
jgi:penicillin-binding protein 1B